MAVDARIQWCTADPPVLVWVDGYPVLVNVFISMPVDYQNLLHTTRATATVNGRIVTISIKGPAAPFTAHAEIWKLGSSAGDPGKIHAPGATVTITFPDVKTGGIPTVPTAASAVAQALR
ncbi:MAG: hypothetical protein HY332_25475 [Chloroflexi bacterium]|nr:hypothetical protein [Chloroflexota bacterium]